MLLLKLRQPWRQPPHLVLFPPLSSFLRLRLFSSSPAPACRDPPPSPAAQPPHFIVDYLIGSCGLSTAEAKKASKYLAHLKSTKKPDAVLRLMRKEGLGDAHIRRLVMGRPTVLAADPEKTLKPKIRALMECGFSGPELARLISSGGVITPLRNVRRHVKFWRDLLGSDENLLKAVDRNRHLLSLRLEDHVVPVLSFLRSLGVSDERIGVITMRTLCLVTSNLDRLKALVEQVKSLGVPPGSGMFVAALCSISHISSSTLEAKMECLRSFGWSQAELISAFQRFPSVLDVSQRKIQSLMGFWLEEAGCSPSYLARRPVLLGLSMKRRLVPRFQVIKSLRREGLPGGDHDLYNVMLLPDKKFLEKYIVPFREAVPGLLDAYVASCRKDISK